MSMDFPATPTTGQTFDPGTGIVYSYDGVAWNAVTTSTATARTRNRITNGAMQVSQENGSSVVTTSGTFPADMWQLVFSGVTGQAVRGVPTLGVSPDGNPFTYTQSFATVKASLAAGDYCQNICSVEGVNIADFMWGTASARQVVLRFNAYADVAGLYSVAIVNGASNRSYVKGINLIVGWQTFVLVIPGDTTGTWPTDNTAGLSVRFCSAVGSTYVGVDGVWQAGAMLGVPGQLNGAAQSSKNLAFTDVGLYLDPDKTGLAPKFEMPNYTEELLRCGRYWRRTSVRVGVSSGTYFGIVVPIEPEMRIAPTGSYADLVGTANRMSIGGNNGYTPAGGGLVMGSNAAGVDLVAPITITNTWAGVGLTLNARM